MKALERRLRQLEATLGSRRHLLHPFADGELLRRARTIVARHDEGGGADTPLLSRVRTILRRFAGGRNA